MERIVMKRVTSLVVCVVAVALLVASASADRGMIRSVKRVNVEEPAQRAIIAYNGAQELLILQTDVRAAEETRIVEFMPLPSKPEVSLAPEGCFAELAKIVQTHRMSYRSRRGGKHRRDAGGAAVTVVVAAQLGPHAVTVVEVKDADAFVTWVKRFFREQDLGEPDLSGQLRGVVSDYLNRKIRFFAFDVVTMSPEKKTVRPLAYSFESDRLYYPLKVTNLYGGEGVVELFVIIPDAFDARRLRDRAFIRIQPGSIRGGAELTGPEREKLMRRAAVVDVSVRSGVVTLKSDELERLHTQIPALAWGGDARMIAVRYEGALRFDADVEGTLGFVHPGDAAKTFFNALRTGKTGVLPAVVGVPFAFDGVEVMNEKAAVVKKFERALAKPLGQPGNAAQIVGTQMPARSYRFVLRDAFSRRFVERHLLKRQAIIVGLTLDGEEALIFVRRDARTWRVVGFRD